MVFLTAYRMALADGELSANEALLLHLFSKSLDVPTEALFHLRQDAEKVDLDSLLLKLPDPAEQRALLETLYLVALADGRMAPQEWSLVTRLAELFEVDRAGLEQCLEAARSRLEKLSEQYDLKTEMEANAETE